MRVFAERQVSARAQVIGEIEIQKATQRRLVKHYHVVQALASNGADEALGVRILPRRLWRGEHFTDANPPDPGPERLPINRIAIPQQITGHIIPRKRLDHLLCRPLRAGMGGDVEMEEAPPLVRQHHEDIENSKGDGRHHEEVRRDQLLRVDIQECTRLWFATDGGLAWIDPAHLAANAVPPPVSILDVSSEKGRQPISDTVKFAAGTPSVEIDYTALSLSIPERVRFRYKLQGLD